MIDVFVSSDDRSISLGQKWLDNITHALKSCTVGIILCSPKSGSRQWINFEAGAAWIREIPVIPLCHSGMKPSLLPIPLNLLQAASASEVSSLNLIFTVLAKAIGSLVPKVDFSDFLKEVQEFEDNYTFWDEVNRYFSEINSWDERVIGLLKQNQTITLNLQLTDVNLWESWAAFLRIKNILDIREIGRNVSVTQNGTLYECLIVPLPELIYVVNDKNFKF
jgi:hypothetical protein